MSDESWQTSICRNEAINKLHLLKLKDMHVCMQKGWRLGEGGEGWWGARCARVLGEWRRLLGRVFLLGRGGAVSGHSNNNNNNNKSSQWIWCHSPNSQRVTLCWSHHIYGHYKGVKIAMIWCNFWSHILSETVWFESQSSQTYHIPKLHPLNQFINK